MNPEKSIIREDNLRKDHKPRTEVLLVSASVESNCFFLLILLHSTWFYGRKTEPIYVIMNNYSYLKLRTLHYLNVQYNLPVPSFRYTYTSFSKDVVLWLRRCVQTNWITRECALWKFVCTQRCSNKTISFEKQQSIAYIYIYNTFPTLHFNFFFNHF